MTERARRRADLEGRRGLDRPARGRPRPPVGLAPAGRPRPGPRRDPRRTHRRQETRPMTENSTDALLTGLSQLGDLLREVGNEQLSPVHPVPRLVRRRARGPHRPGACPVRDDDGGRGGRLDGRDAAPRRPGGGVRPARRGAARGTRGEPRRATRAGDGLCRGRGAHVGPRDRPGPSHRGPGSGAGRGGAGVHEGVPDRRHEGAGLRSGAEGSGGRRRLRQDRRLRRSVRSEPRGRAPDLPGFTASEPGERWET